MMNAALPIRFQVRVQLQALVNGLRRPTSEQSKLLRLATGALQTVREADIAGDLRANLGTLCDALATDRPLDRLEWAAHIDRAGASLVPSRGARASA